MDAADHIEKLQLNTLMYNSGLHAPLPHHTYLTGTSMLPILIILNTSNQPVLDGNNYDLYSKNLLHKGTLSISSLKTSFQEKISRKYVTYISEFQEKWTSKKQYFDSFTHDFVWNNFKIVIDKLLGIRTEYISFGLTEDSSIFFKSKVRNHNVYIELFFDESLKDKIEVIANVYYEGKVKLAYGGTIDNTFDKVQKLFVVQNQVTLATNVPNEIPNAYFATVEL